MVVSLNTFAAFDENGKVVKTWNSEIIESKGLLGKIKTICNEKNCSLRLCFNNDIAVNKFSEDQLNKEVENYRDEDY